MKQYDTDQARKSVLKERARKLAITEDKTSVNSGKEMILLKFQLLPETYAIEFGFIREVSPLKELTTIPNTPAFIMGVMNLRGEIISVVDPKKIFNLRSSGLTEFNKIVVLSHGELIFGMVTDKILGIEKVGQESVLEAPETLSEKAASFIRGICADGTIVLDGKAMMESKSLIAGQKKNQNN